MIIARIEINFRPPLVTDVPSPRIDHGGYIYRIRRESGRIHLCGSINTRDPSRAAEHTRVMARREGYTHVYTGPDSPPTPL